MHDYPVVHVVESAAWLTLEELARGCACEPETIVLLVGEGALEPQGEAPESWRFAAEALRRARLAARLMRDLEVNATGAALALDLLDEIARLRAQLRS